MEMELEMELPQGPKDAMNEDELTNAVDLRYIFAFVWSFGCNLDDKSRPKFNDFANALLAPMLPDGVRGMNLFDYAVDEQEQRLALWTDNMPEFKFDPAASFFTILVPTADTTRYSYLLKLLMTSGRHVLYSGDTGVGKSVIVADTLTRLATDTSPFVTATVNFSAQTQSANLQEVFETKLDKKRKNRLGPPSGKTMLMFIDDVNMPELEVFGAQPPIELLRQVIGQGGFYDRHKLFFKYTADCVFAAACAPPGGGRNEITPRLSQKFHLLWLTSLSEGSMKRIFSAILAGFLGHAAPPLLHLTGGIVGASVAMYRAVSLEMLPTPAKSHYTFNLRDLSKVFQGMMMVQGAELPDKDSLLKLWLHEQARVFRDRLINADDRHWFNSQCAAMLKERLDTDWAPADFANLLMGDYLNREQRSYQLVKEPAKLPALFYEYLDE